MTTIRLLLLVQNSYVYMKMMECFAGIWVIYFWSTYLYYYYGSKFLISSHVSAGSDQSFWLWYMAFLTTNKNKVSCHKQVVIMFEYLLWILHIPACLHILIHISVISKLRYNDSVLNIFTNLHVFIVTGTLWTVFSQYIICMHDSISHWRQYSIWYNLMYMYVHGFYCAHVHVVFTLSLHTICVYI